ncbi:MAG: diguanylate cyclase [Burkholderiaceae bacterium]|nr:diguanylate cyclase [Burkholderiaceae bacterium]
MNENTHRDILTGALNRTALAEWLNHAMPQAHLAGVPLTLAIVDVDHFKSVNDAFGHARGDQILCEIAMRIQRTLRTGDKLFRYGGDEFVLVLQDANLDQAQVLIERLLNVVRDEPFEGKPPLKMTLSIGAAAIEETDGTPEKLFECADARLYLSKRQGRNQLQTSDREEPDMHAVFSEQFQGVTRLLERETTLAAIRSFIESLPARKRARLRIGGEAGCGRSRMIAEAGRYAALMGYGVLSLQGRPGYAYRMYAAVLDARQAGSLWAELPHPLQGEPHFVETLARLLHERAAAGLILLIDGAELIDHSTLALLRAVIASPDIVQVGVLASSDGPLTQFLDCGIDAEISLDPLSKVGTRLWLRGILRWEAPDQFVSEFHALTQGAPGVMQRTLQSMRDMALLVRSAQGWNIHDAWAAALHAKAPRQDARVRPWLSVGEEFVGRETELNLVKQRLQSGGLLTLVAAGGMGKTRLALQAASETHDQFADGVYFVPLAAVESSDLMLPAILQAFNLRLQDGTNPRQLLLNFCSRGQMLIVLDSFDHMTHDLSLVDDLLHASPNLRLLITSREPLHLPSERALRITGLPTADAESTYLPEQAFNSAEILFVQYAHKIQADFVVASDSRIDISRICKAVDGMPLAIKLAAAWVNVFDCAEIADKLEKDPEQANALSVINYFWAQLSEHERCGASALAVFRGGFEQTAAQQVAGISPFFLSALVTKSFLVRNRSGRYDMLELLRQYALRELAAHPERAAALQQAHGDYYLALVQQAATHWHRNGEVFWFERLTAELDNLRAALAAAIDGNRQDQAMCMVADLANFWIGRGLILEGSRWTQLALQQSGAPTLPHFAAATAAMGKLLFWLGQPGQSAQAFETGLEAATRNKLPAVAALCRAWLAAAHFRGGRHTQALELGQQALDVAREAGLPGEHALCLLTLGGVFLERGEQAKAREILTLCLRMFEEQGDARRHTLALNFFGILEFRDCKLDAAVKTLENAVSVAQQNRNRLNYAWSLTNLGAVEIALGHDTAAHQKLAEAQQILHEAGSHDWEAINQVFTAQAWLANGDVSRARAALTKALACALACKSTRRQLLVIAAYAQLAATQHDGERALQLANLVLAHPDSGEEASIPARIALASAGVEGEFAYSPESARDALTGQIALLSNEIPGLLQAS